jgi:GH24 family phage-related lysozyme (muramidase)
MTDEDVRRIESRIKEETLFHPISEWHSPPGGRDGRNIWGWHTEAPGAGLIVNFGDAERGLYQEVIDAFRTYDRIFKDCTVEINPVRRLAMIDMIFDLGEEKFRKMHRFLNRVIHDDWPGAALELRSTIWFTNAPGGRRERRIVREIERGKSDHPERP